MFWPYLPILDTRRTMLPLVLLLKPGVVTRLVHPTIDVNKWTLNISYSGNKLVSNNSHYIAK